MLYTTGQTHKIVLASNQFSDLLQDFCRMALLAKLSVPFQRHSMEFIVTQAKGMFLFRDFTETRVISTLRWEVKGSGGCERTLTCFDSRLFGSDGSKQWNTKSCELNSEKLTNLVYFQNSGFMSFPSHPTSSIVETPVCSQCQRRESLEHILSCCLMMLAEVYYCLHHDQGVNGNIICTGITCIKQQHQQGRPMILSGKESWLQCLCRLNAVQVS